MQTKNKLKQYTLKCPNHPGLGVNLHVLLTQNHLGIKFIISLFILFQIKLGLFTEKLEEIFTS